jgi:hypothetical protein
MGNVAVSEGCVHAGVDAGINIDQRIDMRDRHDAGVHKGDAEIAALEAPKFDIKSGAL